MCCINHVHWSYAEGSCIHIVKENISALRYDWLSFELPWKINSSDSHVLFNYNKESTINIYTPKWSKTANNFNPVFKKMLRLSKASHTLPRTIWDHLGGKWKKFVLLHHIKFDKGNMCFKYLNKSKLNKAGCLLQRCVYVRMWLDDWHYVFN